jgi:hypothetical protein
VARWGWSTQLIAWELWNEVDLTLAPSAAVTAWHADMAALLRALDPNRHLVTTSHALYPLDPNVWVEGGLDFTQIHFYADVFPALHDISATMTSLTADRLAVTGKPVLFGELGLGDLETTRAADPTGIAVHDGLWAGVVSGGIGTGMTWWWNNLVAAEPDRYYPVFGAVARSSTACAGIASGSRRLAPTSRAPIRSSLTASPANGRFSCGSRTMPFNGTLRTRCR